MFNASQCILVNNCLCQHLSFSSSLIFNFNAQAPANPATIAGIQKVCGGWWNNVADAVTHLTLCSCAVPFRLGVHMDQDDNILAAGDVAAGLDHAENTGFAAGTPNTLYNGVGTQGFWLNYWQTSC